MRVSAFVRQAAVAAAAAVVPHVDEEPRQLEPDPGAVALRREIRRLGSNLNQAVRLAHQGGSPDLQAAVEDLRAAVEKVLTREIGHLGSKLAQALKLAHQGGSPDLQAAVEDIQAAVEKVLTR